MSEYDVTVGEVEAGGELVRITDGDLGIVIRRSASWAEQGLEISITKSLGQPLVHWQSMRYDQEDLVHLSRGIRLALDLLKGEDTPCGTEERDGRNMVTYIEAGGDPSLLESEPPAGPELSPRWVVSGGDKCPLCDEILHLWVDPQVEGMAPDQPEDRDVVMAEWCPSCGYDDSDVPAELRWMIGLDDD